MNQHDLRLSLVEWADRAILRRNPDGTHFYECPLCGQPTKRTEYEGYIEVEHHLTDMHYDRIKEIDGHEPHRARLDSLDEGQRTLETFQ